MSAATARNQEAMPNSTGSPAAPIATKELATEAEAQAGELPNIDYALSLLSVTCGLPQDAPFVLFAVGRCVGWLAHALEQAQAKRLIRPRARYTGPANLSAGIY